MSPKSGGHGRDTRRAPAKRGATSRGKSMPEDLSQTGDPDQWERVELQVTRPTSVMVSVRVPGQLVIELESYAASRSLTVSEVIRMAVERFMLGIAPSPTYALLGTTDASSLKLAGPTVMVHAVSTGTRPEWANVPTGSGIVTGTPAT